MNPFNEYMIEELLIRYCEGKTSEEEAALVKNWMKESDENRRTLQRINSLCLAADVRDLQGKIDPAKAFGNVKERITQEETRNGKGRNARTGSKIRTIGIWMQRAAAILFLPMLVLWAMQQWDEQAQAPAKWIEMKANPGMSSSFSLPDGTLVFLNSGSSLTYPERFDGELRNVSLKGEAYFEVSKDPKKKFIVSAPHHTQIEVLGTHFNVEAYEDEEKVRTTLLEGKIGFLFPQGHTRKKVIMAPGKKLVYDADNEEVKMGDASVESVVGWTKGKIILDNTPLEEALRLLGRRFQIDFIIKKESLKEFAFTGTFTNQSLERILDKFRLSSQIRWRYLDDDNDPEKKTRIEIY